MKSTFTAAVAAFAFLISLAAFAQAAKDPVDPHHGETKAKGDKPAVDVNKKLSAKDTQFVIDAAIGNLAEVEMGKLAQQNAASQQAKDFGARLVADHDKAYQELERATGAFGVMLPTQIDAEHQKHSEMLKAKQGAEFDASFAKHMVEGHQKVIAVFKTEAKSGTAPELKAYATSTLPTLEEHLKLAQNLAKTKTSAR
jgi:putative membrane protein